MNKIYRHYMYVMIALACLFLLLPFLNFNTNYFSIMAVLAFVLGAGSILLIRHFDSMYHE